MKFLNLLHIRLYVKKSLWQIDTGFACAGIVCDNQGFCIDAAPIFKWMIGKHYYEIEEWKRIKSIRRVDGK